MEPIFLTFTGIKSISQCTNSIPYYLEIDQLEELDFPNWGFTLDDLLNSGNATASAEETTNEGDTVVDNNIPDEVTTPRNIIIPTNSTVAVTNTNKPNKSANSSSTSQTNTTNSN